MVTLGCSSLRVVQEPIIKLSIWTLLNIPFNFIAIGHLAKRWGKASFSQNSLFGKKMDILPHQGQQQLLLLRNQ